MKLSEGSHGLVEVRVVIHLTRIRISITRTRKYSLSNSKQFIFPNTLHHLRKAKAICQKVSGQVDPVDSKDWKEFNRFSTFQEVEYNNKSGKQVSWFAYRIFMPSLERNSVTYDVYYY